MPDEDTAANTAPQYITKEDFTKAMQDQQSRIAGAMDVFGDQVSQAILDVRGNNSNDDPSPEPVKADGSAIKDAAVKLIDDPDDYINKLVEKRLSQDGDMDAMRNDMFQDRITEQMNIYDAEFGSGAFREQIMPDLMRAAQDLPPKMRASKSHITMLVRSIKGGLPADKLLDKRTAVKQAQKDEEDRMSREAPAMLRGIGVPRSQGDKLDSDELAYLDSLASKGIKYSKEEYIRDRKLGPDIDAEIEGAKKK